jgi:hypothetical protein
MPIVTLVPLPIAPWNASPLLFTIYNTPHLFQAIAYYLQQYLFIYKSLLSSALSLSTIPYQLSPHVATNRLLFQRLPLGVYLFTFCFKRNAKVLWQEVATPLYILKLNYFLHFLIGCMHTTQVF